MNIELHLVNAKKALDLARDKIDREDYNTAITLLASAYSDVRELMEHAWRMKREAALSSNPAGENFG